MTNKTLDLFEYIREKLGCEYISDLPGIAKKSPIAVIHILASVRPSDYPLQQWNDALNYFVKAPVQQTIEDAYSLLIFILSDMDDGR